jgi:hypothetical protein
MTKRVPNMSRNGFCPVAYDSDLSPEFTTRIRFPLEQVYPVRIPWPNGS